MTTEDLISGVDLNAYGDVSPMAFQWAYWWATHAPRARGWLPRKIGRSLAPNMTCCIRTRSGARVAVDPVNLDFYCVVKARDGVWEQDVLDACLKVIAPGDVFYDIGANAGILTLDMAQTFGDSIRIQAFEPQPTLARSLAISIALNGFRNVELHQTLLGEETGERNLFIADHGIHTSLIPREPGAIPLACPMQTLDSLAPASIPAPTVIKIDVEGAEMQVLHGARKALSSAPPAIIFEADENMPRFGYTHKDLFQLLDEVGSYSYYHIRGNELDLVRKPASAVPGNYIAMPQGRHFNP